MNMDFFFNRKTIRKYKSEAIPSDTIERMLDAAAQSPTTGGMQLYSVVITTDTDIKEELAKSHFNQPAATGAPMLLTFCADFNRATKWCECRKASPGYDNFLSFVNAAQDALLYTQTFCNLAEEAGLGLCYLGTTVYMPQLIIDTLQLPRLVMPIATITLGWPDEAPALTDRLPLSAVVHQETYNDYSPEDIDRHYAEKEALPENQEFVKLNNKETLAQIFTDIRYTRKDNEALSATFIETLKKQGFLDE